MTIRDSKFREERNKNVWQDRRSGMKYWELAEKYGVTQARVRQIFESYDQHYNKEEWKIRTNFK